MVKERMADLDKVFAAVAHPIRRAMVERLAEGDCTVGELAQAHDVTAPAISKHLRVLEEAGLLEQTPDGRVRRCSLRAQPLGQAFGWLVQYQLFWTDALDSIARRLESPAPKPSRPSPPSARPTKTRK
ncbi:MAG TPA: metalloregulator ArsR/SmtB family transcription factor [Candidatus Thermoplasmatota archaeon]|nr:metalloregulator ArsR/SmtB family transcription factor [Candidatus Thermoplasmatota archaeon]